MLPIYRNHAYSVSYHDTCNEFFDIVEKGVYSLTVTQNIAWRTVKLNWLQARANRPLRVDASGLASGRTHHQSLNDEKSPNKALLSLLVGDYFAACRIVWECIARPLKFACTSRIINFNLILPKCKR